MATASPLRLLKRDLPPIVNPEPCGCCKHGHAFAAQELVVRNERGEIIKKLVAVPGGFA